MDWKNQIRFPANVATIEISNICNAKCRWCTTGIQNRSFQETAHFMSAELFERGLVRLLELGWVTGQTRVELFNWGEPFLNPQLEQILEIVTAKDLHYCLSTNGSIYKRIPQEVVEHMDFLMISLPGTSQNSYDKIHRLDAKKVRENIIKFAENLTEYGTSYKLFLNFHVYQFNLSEIEEARKLADELGATFVTRVAYFADYHLFQSFLTDTISRKDLRDASEQLFLHVIKKARQDVTCYLWHQVCFDHEFNLVPCCRLTRHEQLGNLFSDSPERLLRAREEYPECKRCMEAGQIGIISDLGQTPDWYAQLLPKLRYAEQAADTLPAVQAALLKKEEHLQMVCKDRETLANDLARAQSALQEVQTAYDAISQAEFWKLTKPFRVIVDRIKTWTRLEHQ